MSNTIKEDHEEYILLIERMKIMCSAIYSELRALQKVVTEDLDFVIEKHIEELSQFLMKERIAPRDIEIFNELQIKIKKTLEDIRMLFHSAKK